MCIVLYLAQGPIQNEAKARNKFHACKVCPELQIDTPKSQLNRTRYFFSHFLSDVKVTYRMQTWHRKTGRTHSWSCVLIFEYFFS